MKYVGNKNMPDSGEMSDLQGRDRMIIDDAKILPNRTDAICIHALSTFSKSVNKDEMGNKVINNRIKPIFKGIQYINKKRPVVHYASDIDEEQKRKDEMAT